MASWPRSVTSTATACVYTYPRSGPRAGFEIFISNDHVTVTFLKFSASIDWNIKGAVTFIDNLKLGSSFDKKLSDVNIFCVG